VMWKDFAEIVMSQLMCDVACVIVVVGVCIFMFKLSWRLSMITVVGLPVITAVSKIYGEFYGVRLFCVTYSTLLLPSYSCSLWITG